MKNTTLEELMKRANPLLAHKITVLYKLCQQRGRIIETLLNWSVSKPEKIAEIERIDKMILTILEPNKKS